MTLSWRTASTARRLCPAGTDGGAAPGRAAGRRVPGGHALAGKATLRAEDVIGFPWMGVPEGFPFDTVLRQIEVQADSPAVRAQTFPDLRVLEALVSAGHGLSLLPRYTA